MGLDYLHFEQRVRAGIASSHVYIIIVIYALWPYNFLLLSSLLLPYHFKTEDSIEEWELLGQVEFYPSQLFLAIFPCLPECDHCCSYKDRTDANKLILIMVLFHRNNTTTKIGDSGQVQKERKLTEHDKNDSPIQYPLYCMALVHCRKDETVRRGATIRSLAICTHLPLFNLFKVSLQPDQFRFSLTHTLPHTAFVCFSHCFSELCKSIIYSPTSVY